jgi:hypothetical protein
VGSTINSQQHSNSKFRFHERFAWFRFTGSRDVLCLIRCHSLVHTLPVGSIFCKSVNKNIF